MVRALLVCIDEVKKKKQTKKTKDWVCKGKVKPKAESSRNKTSVFCHVTSLSK